MCHETSPSEHSITITARDFVRDPNLSARFNHAVDIVVAEALLAIETKINSRLPASHQVVEGEYQIVPNRTLFSQIRQLVMGPRRG